LRGEKVMVEYTDPNPFKEFHIGHLMSNAIGESVSRLFEWNGAEVKRVCYQGDVGIHVAKAVWGLLRNERDPYVAGSKAYDESEEWRKEIQEYNKQIYDRSSPEINRIYDLGKKASLNHFDSVYRKLGTKFDIFLMESEAAPVGRKIVEENTGKIFEKSDLEPEQARYRAGGAIIFRGEKYDPKLHTRVFINSEGIPTYEAKDLGNALLKAELYPYTQSVVVTGNEIKEYFKVMLQALKLIYPDLAEKTKHLPHGMLRLPTGKMSSRTGDVITAEELIDKVKKVIEEKGNKADDDIAVGAIKYMILRQGIGNDIIFDFEKSVSTEGDSGVYLQYAYARTNSVLEKAGMNPSNLPLSREVDANTSLDKEETEEIRTVERLLYRFPEIVVRAGEEYAPQLVTTYLTELASAFNNFYAQEQIVSSEPESPYRLAITKAFNIVMRNGLTILGIPTPERI